MNIDMERIAKREIIRLWINIFKASMKMESSVNKAFFETRHKKIEEER